MWAFHRGWTLGVSGVSWACHSRVDQPEVGGVTVLLWNLWSLWPLPTVLCPSPGGIWQPPVPQRLRWVCAIRPSGIFGLLRSPFRTPSFWTRTTGNICLEGGKALCFGRLFCVDPFPLPSSWGKRDGSQLWIWEEQGGVWRGVGGLSSKFRKKIGLGQTRLFSPEEGPDRASLRGSGGCCLCCPRLPVQPSSVAVGVIADRCVTQGPVPTGSTLEYFPPPQPLAVCGIFLSSPADRREGNSSVCVCGSGLVRAQKMASKPHLGTR